MDYNTIKALLDKYWEGQTSLEEEQMLKTYFQQDNLPEEWKSYAPFFQMLVVESKTGPSSDFDSRWTEEITKQSPSQPKRRQLYRWTARVAAILLFFSSSLYLLKTFPSQNHNQIAWEEETYENPEEAYAKAKEVLLLLSSKMQHGTDKASDGVKKVQEASTIIKLKK